MASDRLLDNFLSGQSSLLSAAALMAILLAWPAYAWSAGEADELERNGVLLADPGFTAEPRTPDDGARLQIDSLHRQNQMLTLQRENHRLYLALLLAVTCLLVCWAGKTKLSQLHFMRLSRHDGLTGSFNRPHFIEQANLALAEGRKQARPICVMLYDLDHFKAINDRFGHAAGDAVLKQTVTACEEHLGPHDLFGRFGGEEFSILLNACDLATAQHRAEQMRISISRICVAHGGNDCSVSASFGVAATCHSGYELRKLLADADAALYRAKDSGRNRVASFDNADAITAAARREARSDEFRVGTKM